MNFDVGFCQHLGVEDSFGMDFLLLCLLACSYLPSLVFIYGEIILDRLEMDCCMFCFYYYHSCFLHRLAHLDFFVTYLSFRGSSLALC